MVGEPEAFSTARMTFRACRISCRNHPPGAAGPTIITGTGSAGPCSQLHALLRIHPRGKRDGLQITAHQKISEATSLLHQKRRLSGAVRTSAADTRLSTPPMASSRAWLRVCWWPWQGNNGFIPATAHKGSGELDDRSFAVKLLDAVIKV